MTEAIKVKLKFDNAGFGHDRAEEFTFQWWDHVFNKAAENISVSKNEKGGIELQRKKELVVTKSRPSIALAMKEKLYGSFVKGGTLQGSDEVSTKDSSDESDQDDEPRDMSMKLSDDQLFKLCGGRTAHKGARHGLNMNAKLERIRKQEEELMRKWKGEAQQDTSSQLSSVLSNDIRDSGQGTPTEKKKKKKKHKEVIEESLSNTGYEKTKNKRTYTCDEENTGEKKTKKKKKHLDQDTMDDSGIESVEYEINENSKKKKKQKEKECIEDIGDYKSKSNKKRKFEHKIEEQGQNKKKKKESKKYNNQNDNISEISGSPDVTLKKKKKKKKKEKDKLDFSEVEVKKKKKNKKSKEMDANIKDNYEGNGINTDELNIISPECKEEKKKKTEKLVCSAVEEVEVKIKKKKKSKKSKEKEYEGNESHFEKLSTISTEIKETKKMKAIEISAPETEIREVKKKRKSKDTHADIQSVSNLENKAIKKKKKKYKLL